MEENKYGVIKRFCDADIKLEELNDYLVSKKDCKCEEYKNLIKQKEDLYIYAKALAEIIARENLIEQLADEVNSALIDCDVKAETKKKNIKSSIDKMNEDFAETIKSATKRCFGIDVDVVVTGSEND